MSTTDDRDGKGEIENENEPEETISENFTPIQTKKRLPQPISISCTSLCPSMDLVAIGLLKAANVNANNKVTSGKSGEDADVEMKMNQHASASSTVDAPADAQLHDPVPLPVSSNIIVYRTISWQKMFTISQADITNAANSMDIDNTFDNPTENDEHEQKHEHEHESKQGTTSTSMKSTSNLSPKGSVSGSAEVGATYLTWSPDGRILVITLSNGSTLFYDIESCASPGVPPNPIYAIPPPPIKPLLSGVATAVASEQALESQGSSPPVTRSMTNARRKRLMRMVGKTPSQNDVTSSNRIRGAKTSTNANANANANANVDARFAPSVSSVSKQIKSMHWQRIRIKDSEEWPFRQYYLDRSTFFLPQCHYTMEGDGRGGSDVGSSMNTNIGSGGGDVGGGAMINRHASKGETPLSILMTLSDAGLSLYLNGRYRIISIGSTSANDINGASISGSTDIVSTSNFHILASKQVRVRVQNSSTNSLKLHLYTIPSLIPHRYNLQFISYSYGAITSHLKTMKKGMEEAYSAWSTSLRQLDMKFDQLLTLLGKYNVISQSASPQDKVSGMRLELLNYILGGHSSRSGDSSNAMDQFFTHPLMNDQLLIRLFRSLEANVAGVEGLLRKRVLGPVRSLLYDVGELNGLVKIMNAKRPYEDDYGDGDEGSIDNNGEDNEGRYDDQDEDELGLPALMDNDTSLRLCEMAGILFTISEQCVSQLVEIRHRQECITKWIRGTSSQVKARGTAADSVQRENARKRRVPEQVLRKVSDFLSTPLNSAPGDLSLKRGSTECILGILLSDYFSKDSVFLEKTHCPLEQKENFFSDGFHSFVETPSLKAALDVTREIASELFNEPRKVMTKAVNTIEVVSEEVQNCGGDIVSAIHSRFSGKHSSTSGNIDDDEENKFARSAHWTIVANTCESSYGDCQLVQLSAIPIGDDSVCETNIGSSHCRPLYYMTTFLKIPEGCSVTDIKFYGDDGNSTLTSESSPSYQEGRQSVGVLLKRKSDYESMKEELWLLDYDEIEFRDEMLIQQYQQFGNAKFIIRKFNSAIDLCVPVTNDINLDDGRHLISKCKDYLFLFNAYSIFVYAISHVCFLSIFTISGREMRSKLSGVSSSLIMSGSRGIGGVTCGTTNTIDLLDLEEDEDSDEESDED